MPGCRISSFDSAPQTGVDWGLDTPNSPQDTPMALTDTAIRNAKPAAKPVKMFDGGGLYLLVQPTGGKLWRHKYRFGGTEKLLSLGAYPQIGLKAAARMKREEAFARARARQAAADGGGSSMSGSSQACTQAKRSYEVEASSITKNLNAIRKRQQEVENACDAPSVMDANHARIEEAERRRQERIAALERDRELSRSQFNNARVIRCDRGGCDTTAGRLSGGNPNALSAPGGGTCRIVPGGALSCP